MVKLFVYLPLFQALWALHARAHDADHVHPITAAPAESLVHQKRAGIVDCTEWSLVGGDHHSPHLNRQEPKTDWIRWDTGLPLWAYLPLRRLIFLRSMSTGDSDNANDLGDLVL